MLRLNAAMIAIGQAIPECLLIVSGCFGTSV
jgi:hypothetical protein